jgi:hypothetical protein
LVFRRLKFIGAIIGLSVIGLATALALLSFGVTTTEPATLLTVFGFLAATITLFSALLSASILLLGGFVSRYISALAVRVDSNESFREAKVHERPGETHKDN